jgi:hypothetical protein
MVSSIDPIDRGSRHRIRRNFYGRTGTIRVSSIDPIDRGSRLDIINYIFSPFIVSSIDPIDRGSRQELVRCSLLRLLI